MFLTNDNLNLNIDIVAAAIAGIAVVTTVIIFILSITRENKNRFIDNFNKMYSLTFNLRNKINEKYSNELHNNEFFYEIDNILDNINVREMVLDYLTEMEDLFFLVVGHKTINKSFEKLMSVAMYERLVFFLGFIYKLRKINNNDKMFLNYVKAIGLIEKMDKIKDYLREKENIVYIGIRNSDCEYSNYFKHSISMFSKDSNNEFLIRPNQNKANKEFIPYIENEIDDLLKKDKKLKLMFYNNLIAYRLPVRFQKHFMCCNDLNLLHFFNNKIECKLWFINNLIPTIPYETFLGKEIIESKFNDIFKTKEIIIQNTNGGGGIGTYVVTKNNFENIKEKLSPLKQYLISSYINHSISANTHVFISEKQTVLSPGSIQIVEKINDQLCYRGGDFIAFKELSSMCKNKIKSLSLEIANLLRPMGYRGVAGIDFLIDEKENVYCTEINPRFQSSSVLLDIFLSNNKNDKNIASSIFQLNEQAFRNNFKTDLSFEDDINLSCYYYYKENDSLSKEYFEYKAKCLAKKGALINLDGLSFNDNINIDNDSYMFSAIFDHEICTISPDNDLWVNDNINISPKPKDILSLKIALLNQGVRINNKSRNIKKGVYESVDIVFSSEEYTKNNEIDINCAYQINYSHYSPFVLDCKDNKLYYYNEILGNFKIEHNLLKRIPKFDRKILYLATDRLRIKIIGGCEFKSLGDGCEFCNLPVSKYHFTIEQITQALKKLKKLNVNFNHILIGGGTCLDKDFWDEVKNLSNYLKTNEFFKDKPISLMSILPPTKQLQSLKDYGISEVAFNLEIANENIAKKNMPGKHYIKQHFYDVMKEAIKIFGKGSVRSALIVGLDKQSDLLNEINELAKIGVLPCLSSFRALPKSHYQDKIHPTNRYLEETYLKACGILEHSSYDIKCLGPKCKHCQNNMLII